MRMQEVLTGPSDEDLSTSGLGFLDVTQNLVKSGFVASDSWDWSVVKAYSGIGSHDGSHEVIEFRGAADLYPCNLLKEFVLETPVVPHRGRNIQPRESGTFLAYMLVRKSRIDRFYEHTLVLEG